MGIINSATRQIRRDYTVEELSRKADELRVWTLTSLVAAGSGHLGGCMSIMDVSAALYLKHASHDPENPTWAERDRVFWSVGHKAPALYASLGMAGYFDNRPVTFHGEAVEGMEDVKGVEQCVLLRKLGSGFEGHPNRMKLPGIELSSGSLGQGLGAACGAALSAKLRGADWKCYVLLGEGEHDEGSVWESVMFAAHHEQDNVIAIVDCNGFQIDGSTEEVMRKSLADKYLAFGWEVIECDGHDMQSILDALKIADEVEGKPAVILADTVKGKGASYAEGICGYHGMPPKDGRCGAESLECVIEELGLEDVFTPALLDRSFEIAERYQEEVDQRVEAMVPKFAHDYWWNSTENMQAKMDATRNGFGSAISALGADKNVCALGADITASIRMDYFYKPDGKTEDAERLTRFFSCGIAEANMTLVAAGLAKEGHIPFGGSYGVFSTGRNWDQLRTTVAYNNYGVKMADAHGGISVGPDGATHQSLEEISLITILPNFIMAVPADSVQTDKATNAIAGRPEPAVVRYAREATPVVTTPSTPYEFGVANVIRFRGEQPQFIDAFDHIIGSNYASEDEDVAIIACGPMVPEAMRAAWILKAEYGLETRVVDVHTVKPLDEGTIARAANETKAIVTAEEHQVGGFGNLIAGAISRACCVRPIRLAMVGVQDRFGDSGQPWELVKSFGLTAEHIATKCLDLLKQ